jgi:hypothetical protein
MEKCKYGTDPEAQKECEEYEESSINEYCFKFRKKYGNHCNGLSDRTKENEE